MSDLAASASSLKFLLARPGTFATIFPETTDADLAAVLSDAFAECQLESLFSDYTLSGSIVTPDLTAGESALVVLTAGIRFVRAELFNRPLSRRYTAGPATFEETLATNVMRDIMKALEAKRKTVLDDLARGAATSAFLMADSYLATAWGCPPSSSDPWGN